MCLPTLAGLILPSGFVLSCMRWVSKNCVLCPIIFLHCIRLPALLVFLFIFRSACTNWLYSRDDLIEWSLKKDWSYWEHKEKVFHVFPYIKIQSWAGRGETQYGKMGGYWRLGESCLLESPPRLQSLGTALVHGGTCGPTHERPRIPIPPAAPKKLSCSCVWRWKLVVI